MKLSKTSNIFKKMFKIVSLSTMALSLSLVSCGGIDEQDEKTQAVAVEAGKGVVNFSLSSDFARTIKPSFAGWEGITFTVKTSLSEKALASGKSASELAGLSVAVPEGEQTFTIEAYKGENLVLSDSKTVTVAEASTKTIAFELKAAESGKGSVEVSVTLAEGSAVKAVLSKTEFSDAEAKTAAKGNGAISVADGKITKTEIDVGTYWLYFVVTTSDGDTIVFPEYVYVLNGETSTATKDLSVEALEELVQANFVSLDFAEAKQWNGVPKRTTDKGNVASKVERTESNPYAGYLGKGFYLVNGLFAEYNSKDENTNSIGYTHVANDAVAEGASRPDGFVKAVESEAIPGPFKFSVTTGTNNASRKIKIYVSSSKENLWDESSLVVEEALNANSNVHTYLYEGAGSACIGFGTEPDSDGKVYTAISSIKIATDGSLKVDSFPATGISFTNSGIENGALTLTKDSIPEDGYQLTTTVTPDYANDKTVSFSVTGNTKVSVSETGLVTAASDMSTNENVTIIAKANGGSDVTATLALTVKAEADPADKVSTTVNELKTALNAAGSSFSYGNTATVVNNANSFIGTLTLTYSDVEITPSLDATTGKLTFTVKTGDVTDDSLTVEYTENLAKAAVAEAVSEVKAKLADVSWTTDAATTKSAVDEALAGVVLTDAELSIETVSTEDNGDTVVVTIKNTVKGSGETAISVTDSSIVYESPKFEVTDGVLNLLAKKYEYYLNFDSVTSKTGDDAWTSTTSTVSKDGRYGTEVFKTTFTGFDFKGSSTITLKFAGVAKLALWMKGSAGRTFKVGDTTYELNLSNSVGNSGNTPASYNTGDNWRFDIKFTDLVSVQSFVMTAGSSSIYPLGVILYAPTGEATGINATENLPASDITLAQDSSNSNKFIVTGTPVETAGSTITWYVNDVARTTGTSQTTVAGDTFTLSGDLGTTYEVRVDVTANGITYSESESVMYK